MNENSDQETFHDNLQKFVRDHPTEGVLLEALENDGFTVQSEHASGTFSTFMCEVRVWIRWQADSGRITSVDGSYTETCM